MKSYLTAEEIFPYLHGACGTYRLGGRIGFSRFTEEQLRYYENRIADDFVRSRSPAGIYLECTTDAPEITFMYRIWKEKGYYRTRSGFDIWEDGVLTAGYPLDLESDEACVRYRRQKTSPSVIRITFPCGVIVLPDRFSLGSAVPTPRKPKTLLLYGDSLTQSAYEANPSLSWCVPAAKWLGAECINRGIGSMIFDAASLPAEPDCIPDWIVIEYGGNDLYRIPDTYAALTAAEAWLEKLCLLYPGAAKYAVLPDLGPRTGGSAEKWRREDDYCASLASICRNRGIIPLPGRELIPPMPVLYFEDETHFNEAGSAIFANNLLYAMEKRQ